MNCVKISCPPAPKKGFVQYIDTKCGMWCSSPSTSPTPKSPPPTPIVGYTVKYNFENDVWIQIPKFDNNGKRESRYN